MKLAVLGGGGFRTPAVWQALIRDQGAPSITEVVLYDVDEQRLAVMSRILTSLSRSAPDAPSLRTTTDLREALRDSAFVFSALRIGGTEGRRRDEHVALDLGVVGQETTGPGGLAYALRTIPTMLDIAAVIADIAPDAYLINFTNPAGIVTQAVQQVLGDRALGICDTPSGLGLRVLQALGLSEVPLDRVRLDYLGLNHLGWLRRVIVDDVDLLPRLLADDAALDRLEESELFGRQWLRALGAIPNEYLYYYYRNAEAVTTLRAAGSTRGDVLSTSQAEFFATAAASADPASVWVRAAQARSASYMAEARGRAAGEVDDLHVSIDPVDEGYAGVALKVMSAISRAQPTTMILNVRNRGIIAGLPFDAVVEVPTLVDATGVHPLATDPPTLHQLGLMAQLKAVEQAVIAAAVSGSRDLAVTAFGLHPLVPSTDLAERLVDAYIAAQPELAAVLKY